MIKLECLIYVLYDAHTHTCIYMLPPPPKPTGLTVFAWKFHMPNTMDFCICSFLSEFKQHGNAEFSDFTVFYSDFIKCPKDETPISPLRTCRLQIPHAMLYKNKPKKPKKPTSRVNAIVQDN